MSSKRLTDLLECPVCLDLMEGQILQCRNGHGVCKKCRVRMSKCPLCGRKYGSKDIRCLALENLRDVISSRPDPSAASSSPPNHADNPNATSAVLPATIDPATESHRRILFSRNRWKDSADSDNSSSSSVSSASSTTRGSHYDSRDSIDLDIDDDPIFNDPWDTPARVLGPGEVDSDAETEPYVDPNTERNDDEDFQSMHSDSSSSLSSRSGSLGTIFSDDQQMSSDLDDSEVVQVDSDSTDEENVDVVNADDDHDEDSNASDSLLMFPPSQNVSSESDTFYSFE